MKNRAKTIVPSSYQGEFEYSFDAKALLAKQKKLQINYEKSVNDNTVIQYTEIKFKGIIYECNQYIEIYDITLKSPYVGKITRIVKIPDKLEKLPFIEIEWCFKKHDLPDKIQENIGKHLSQAQFFPTNIKCWLYVQSIKGKCSVLSIDEFSQMALTPEYCYFSRADFNEDTNEFTPPPRQWKSYCTCQMPLNPDCVYVQCQQCQKWFHADCVNVIDLNLTYVCQKCTEESDYL